MSDVTVEERQRRADAQRNRQRVLEAAERLFRERGLDVGVAEIAQAAGVGRGTLFRNFACKEDLIAAIVVERMHEGVARGEELLDAADPAEALFGFLAEMAGRQQLNRALFEAIDESWLTRDPIREAHGRVVEILGRLLARAQAAGAVRPDVGAMDLLMMFKGACTAATAYAHIDPSVIDRQLDLIRAGLTVAPETRPLRGRSLTLEDLGLGAGAGAGEG
jgi:AcrR family transcriptional regulator